MLARRAFLAGLAALPILSLVPARRARAALSEDAKKLLPVSPFVYVSPLRADGSESTCHGEVWYAWLDGKVVLITARDRWKARAVARGLDRARIAVFSARLCGREERDIDVRLAPLRGGLNAPDVARVQHVERGR